MDETKRRLGLRAVIGVVAVVLVVAVFWAASALAAGGSPAGERGARDSPAAANVQNDGEAPDDDCPNRGRDSEDSSNA
jgi:hypothetical protein